jgi:hypothetical protein
MVNNGGPRTPRSPGKRISHPRAHRGFSTVDTAIRTFYVGLSGGVQRFPILRILTRWCSRHSLQTQPAMYAALVPCLRSARRVAVRAAFNASDHAS